MSKFYNPKIQNVSVIVEGKPNQLYTQGMRSFEQYDEICKYFAEGKQRDNDANEIQKHLQLYDLSLGEYLVNRYALWLDFRTINENEPHGTGRHRYTALFVAPTGVGKTHLALSLLETEHKNHFDFIVIICPTLKYNCTYKNQSWVWNDPDAIPIEPGNQLYYLIEKISNLLTGDKTLFLIDDIIADETLDKCRQPLLELVISGRHRGHSLWLLTHAVIHSHS